MIPFLALMPETAISAPSTIPATEATQRRRRVVSNGGSGRSRIADDDVHPADARGRERDDGEREQAHPCV